MPSPDYLSEMTIVHINTLHFLAASRSALRRFAAECLNGEGMRVFEIHILLCLSSAPSTAWPSVLLRLWCTVVFEMLSVESRAKAVLSTV